MAKRFLFVCGCPRSGTTALFQLLTGHPDVVLGAERFIGIGLQEGGRALVPQLFSKERFFDLIPGDTFYQSFEPFGSFYDEMKARYDSAKWVGDKSPTFFRILDQIESTFGGDAHVFFIARDPDDVASSYQVRANNTLDQTWDPTRNYSLAVEEWNEANRSALAFADRRDRRTGLTILAYRDLFDRDCVDIRPVFAELDLDVPASLERLYEAMMREAARLASNRKQILTPEQQAFVLAKADRQVEALVLARRLPLVPPATVVPAPVSPWSIEEDIREIGLQGVDEPYDPQVDRAFPHLRAFHQSVAALNQTSGPARVRNYLTAMIERGGLDLVSPTTGATLRSGATFLPRSPKLPRRTPTIIGFPDEPGTLLVADDISLGYPILGAIAVSEGRFLRTAKSAWGITLEDIPHVLAAIEEAGWQPRVRDQETTLVIGDENFAHTAWNQLGAVEQLLALKPGLPVIETARPLGPVASILPVGRSRFVPDASLPTLCTPGSCYVMAGSMRIPATLAATIVETSRQQMSEEARRILAEIQDHPVLWISVRTRNKVLTNQVGVLSAIAARFLSDAPGSHVVIDGFSRAFDEVQWTNESVAADLSVANEIIRTVGHPNIHPCVGLSVRDGIALSSFASAYFCNSGTVQHKVGWFSAIPGVVHGNSSILRDRELQAWAARLSEAALPPTYLPEEQVRDLAPGSGAYAGLQHLMPQQDYEVVDIAATVSFVFGALRSRGVFDG